MPKLRDFPRKVRSKATRDEISASKGRYLPEDSEEEAGETGEDFDTELPGDAEVKALKVSGEDDWNI